MRGMVFWLPTTSGADLHAAFRGRFASDAARLYRLRAGGSVAFRIWLDGEHITDGPVRFAAAKPDILELPLPLAEGEHVLAIHAHFFGVETRLWPDRPPGLCCELLSDGGESLDVIWKAIALEGFASQVRRINPQLGWIEWCDTSKVPEGWQGAAFDDDGWPDATDVGFDEPEPSVADIPAPRFPVHRMEAIAQGELAERFGYERDDIPARFHLRSLDPEQQGLPAEGIWRRYDLGRVRLGAPRLEMDLPPGAVVEIALAESLIDGRVAPYIPLSAGASCNLDRYIARGGPQTFFPLSPKGGRFCEVHIIAKPDSVRFLDERFVEKTAYGDPAGKFSCGDPQIERIWRTGVETFRACSEDALTDNPTRERGQWLGDAAVGLEIASVAFSDLRLIKRSLEHSALCARKDGLVGGLTPGGVGYVASYALLWMDTCWRFYRHSGDGGFLERMLPYARRNFEAFLPSVSKEGLNDSLEGGDAWIFIDWAYQRPDGPVDPAYNLYFYRALRSLAEWAKLCGDDRLAQESREIGGQVSAAIGEWLDARLEKGSWEDVGWHTAGLLLATGLLSPERTGDCVAFLKTHFEKSFPNTRDAPRLRAPGAAAAPMISPFFCHFVLPAMIERGEIDFALEQIRRCWGWALGEGRTTWLEVFDTRWSHCHQWSGCPTWILSRYLLGLHPREDSGPAHFQLRLRPPATVNFASGTLPGRGAGEKIEISWKRTRDTIAYRIHSNFPIVVEHAESVRPRTRVTGEWTADLSAAP